MVMAAGMALLMGAGTATAAPPTTECDDGDARTNVVKRTVTVGRRSRSYWLSVPPGGVTNAPLLVSLHGAGRNFGCDHAAYTRWASDSIDSGRSYVVVFPNNSSIFWDIDEGSRDVLFVRAVVEAVGAEVSIDPARIYITGHSNGAWMAQRVGCDAEDLFAAATAYAGGDIAEGAGGCELSRGIAVGFWHGAQDTTIPIDQGRSARDAWAVRDSCTTRQPDSGEPDRVTWSGCRDGVEVEWTVLTGQGHDWPTGTSNDAMRSEMWTFFDAFLLP